MKVYLLESRSFNKFKGRKWGCIPECILLQVALGVASSPSIKRALRMRERKVR